MKKVLVTGALGQLGTELQLLTAGRPEFVFTDVRTEGPVRALDILDPGAIAQLVDEEEIGTLINCAAYTNVDLAESQQELCQAINADGPGNLARIATRKNLTLIHISTEYVFDGRNPAGYSETARRHPCPLMDAASATARTGSDAAVAAASSSARPGSILRSARIS